ncbi:MAG: hypothetical protein IPH89_03215 [Bacteroidetes bacterium]|nr:hypothetical protein [Bacteroidota bacterium]
MQQTRKYLIWIAIVFALVFLSFYRDYFFRCINAMLMAWDYDMDYPMPTHLSFFEQLEYSTVNLKWFFTLFFAFLFYLTSHLAINYQFSNKNYNRITFYLFAGLTVLSALFIGIGFLTSALSERMYEFARFLMGLAQSPLVLMVLIPAFMLVEKEKQKA